MHSVKLAAAALAAAMLAASAAQATPVLDQSSAPGGWQFGEFFHWEQQVTAGMSGELAGITLYGMGTTLDVGVNPGDAWEGSGPFAFTGHETLTSGGTFIDTSAAHITLNAGDHFVIDLQNGANGNLLGTGVPYAGGDTWLSICCGFAFDYTVSTSGQTLAFQTYMSQAGVGSAPEPAAWAILLTGFAGLGGALRRRRAAVASA
jgi:hypothetical protein